MQISELQSSAVDTVRLSQLILLLPSVDYIINARKLLFGLMLLINQADIVERGLDADSNAQ